MEGGRVARGSGEWLLIGALQPGTARSILVISDDGELAVALRERIEPRGALIRDVRRSEAALGVAACLPHPWMVVGEGPLPAVLVPMLRRCPVLVVWRGAATLPPHAQRFDGFADLCALVEAAVRSSVGGMRLAPGEGVEMQDGAQVGSASLQVLVAAHPRTVPVTPQAARTVRRLLLRHGARARLEHAGGRSVALR
jgi:hypothetical protein